jgi:Glyoxalase-like domain
MTSSLSYLTFDAHDAYAQATWWAQVLGGQIGDDDAAGDPEAQVLGPSTPLLFVNVPEAKSVKNRAHLDLIPDDRTRDEEVDRVLALGATFLDDQRQADGRGWVVLADPEGNEFCILRGILERTATL